MSAVSRVENLQWWFRLVRPRLMPSPPPGCCQSAARSSKLKKAQMSALARRVCCRDICAASGTCYASDGPSSRTWEGPSYPPDCCQSERSSKLKKAQMSALPGPSAVVIYVLLPGASGTCYALDGPSPRT